jgi:hypothetical protein
MTYVTHTGNDAELWRFDTHTRRWELVHNTAANGVGPTGRINHVMTSVGVDLWLHGGLTEGGVVLGDLWCFDTRRDTHGWELVHDTPIIDDWGVQSSTTGPIRRYSHVMTSVGQDLWLHGGVASYYDSGEGDTCSSPATLLLLL